MSLPSLTSKKKGEVMIEDIVGSRVVITIANPHIQDWQLRPKVEILERSTIAIVAKVVATDELGIWIEHSEYPISFDGEGRPRKEKANILIRYEFITSIAYFPNLPKEKAGVEHKIGFLERKE